MKKTVHVAVGVIQRGDGAILIAKRPDHAHQGGLWEFPGGKVEPGETVQAALQRELFEELDLSVKEARPLIQIHHDYVDKSVLLDVWLITEFSGNPHGKEGQPLQWCAASELEAAQFPAANTAVIRSIQLPTRYWITPEPDLANLDLFWQQIDQKINSGIELIQLRLKQLEAKDIAVILTELVARAKAKSVRVLVNSVFELADICDGVHLTSNQLSALKSRPITSGKLVGASCHSLADLANAELIGCDFAVLSPVKITKSHPDASPIGWECFAAWVQTAKIPVYALGGMSNADLELAWLHGGQGIAGISGLSRMRED